MKATRLFLLETALSVVLCGSVCAIMSPVVDDSLEVWFRADKGCISPDGDLCWGHDDPVATWQDWANAAGQSGANNAAQTASANRPKLFYRTLNFWPVVRFDESTASKQYLATGPISGFDNRSVFTSFVVASPTGSADDVDLFFVNVYANHKHLWGAAATLGTPITNSFFARGNWEGSPSYKGALGAGVSGFNVTEGAWTADDTVRVFVNGVAGTTASDADWQPDDHEQMSIGRNATSDGNALSGDLAEILIYSRELSEAERHQVGEYLEAKYNLTTAYVTADPTGVRFSHSGSADPETEGWLHSHKSNAWEDDANCSAGAVTGDGGYDAWGIDDGSGGGDTVYPIFGGLTAEERAAAVTNGWILRARARVVAPKAVNASSQCMSLQISHPSLVKTFYLFFGADADTNAVVGVYNGPGSFTEHNVGSGGYHLYEMRYKPSLGQVELYVDGADTGIDYAGFDNTDGYTRIIWGSNSSAGTGHVNYNLVEFEILSGGRGTLFMLR